MAENRVLAEDPLIAALVPDPAEVPNVRMHVGFLGKSLRKGSWRLYTTPRLNVFFEIREEDIVHAEQLGSEQTSLRGTVVWIKADAQVVRTRTDPQQSQADFLTGDIAGGFLSGTRGGQLGWGTWTTVLTTVICIIVVSGVCTVNCETRGASSGMNSCCMCAP